MKISKATEQEMAKLRKEHARGRSVLPETGKILNELDKHGTIKIECDSREEALTLYTRLKTLFRNYGVHHIVSIQSTTLYLRKADE